MENVVKVDQISPRLDGNFAAEITVGGSLWKQDGFYTVTVQQFDDPKYTASTEVDIKDGVSSTRIWYNRSNDSSSSNYLNNCNFCKIKT